MNKAHNYINLSLLVKKLACRKDSFLAKFNAVKSEVSHVGFRAYFKAGFLRLVNITLSGLKSFKRYCSYAKSCLCEISTEGLGMFVRVSKNIFSHLKKYYSLIKHFNTLMFSNIVYGCRVIPKHIKIYGLSITLHKINRYIKKLIHRNKKAIFKTAHIVSPILSIVILFCTVWHFNTRSYGLMLEHDGHEMGTVQSEKTLEVARNLVNKRLTSNNIYGFNPNYTLIVANNKSFSDPSTVFDKIVESSNDFDKACGLYVNDKLIGAVRGNPDVQSLIKSTLKNILISKSNNAPDASFNEKIEVLYGLFPTENVMTLDKLQELLNSNVVEEQFYTVEKGDAALSIAKKFNMSFDELNNLNGGNINDHIYEGDKIKVSAPKSIINVKLSRELVYEKEIPFNTVTTTDANQYKGYSKVVTEGQTGLERFVDKVTYIGNKEVSRESVSRTVIKQPVDKKVVIGGKNKPKKSKSKNIYTVEGNGKSTGTLMWPSSYTKNVTSGFGSRWGCMHWGIDISSPGIHNTPVIASDGGVVVFAGANGNGYGNHVKIAHSNGITTLYGHCERLCVKKGQKVSKGQTIGTVGKSGFSTGYHLHFEVAINGRRVNPRRYA